MTRALALEIISQAQSRAPLRSAAVISAARRCHWQNALSDAQVSHRRQEIGPHEWLLEKTRIGVADN
jgi:hypothetical protein